jgi:hypothetical protein
VRARHTPSPSNLAPPPRRLRSAPAAGAGPWTSEDREPRDLFVSGDAFIGRNVSDENFTLSVRGVAEVSSRNTLRPPASALALPGSC